MKRIIMRLFLILILVVSVKVEAKEMNYNEFEKTGIIHAYIVGDYIFDLSYGYTPSLRDFMIASRSIPKGEETYLHEIDNVKVFDIFRKRSVYDNKVSENVSDFGIYNVKYIYRNNITSANDSEKEVL